MGSGWLQFPLEWSHEARRSDAARGRAGRVSWASISSRKSAMDAAVLTGAIGCAKTWTSGGAVAVRLPGDAGAVIPARAPSIGASSSASSAASATRLASAAMVAASRSALLMAGSLPACSAATNGSIDCVRRSSASSWRPCARNTHTRRHRRATSLQGFSGSGKLGSDGNGNTGWTACGRGCSRETFSAAQKFARHIVGCAPIRLSQRVAAPSPQRGGCGRRRTYVSVCKNRSIQLSRDLAVEIEATS